MKITAKSKIGVVYAHDKASNACFKLLSEYLPLIKLDKSHRSKVDLVLVIGGDGTMLHAIHDHMNLHVPFYGINTGRLGFLMNHVCPTKHDKHHLSLKHLLALFNNTESVSICPLEMRVRNVEGEDFKAMAINEVSLLRQTCQTAEIEISINNEVQLESLVSDGVMVSTPAGSSAYNSSAGGNILPIKSNLLALTPISPFRPRRWQGALLQSDSAIDFKIISPTVRSVSATADFFEIRNAAQVHVRSLPGKKIRILFDKSESFGSRVMKEQFVY